MESELKLNIEAVRRRIDAAARRAGRNPDEINLVAVTKTVSAERLQEALSLGLGIFGENKVQEALPKMGALKSAEWHFIGHLQSNKAGKAAENFSLIQSVDSAELAEVLDRRAAALGKVLDVLAEVKFSSEATKFGLEPPYFGGFLEVLKGFDHLRCRGLMAMAPFTDDVGDVRQVFRQAHELWKRHANDYRGQPILSMGMTDDFEIAVEEGSTMVRIGRALFGPRGKKA